MAGLLASQAQRWHYASLDQSFYGNTRQRKEEETRTKTDVPLRARVTILQRIAKISGRYEDEVRGPTSAVRIINIVLEIYLCISYNGTLI